MHQGLAKGTGGQAVNPFAVWWRALRPRTLVLSLASVATGLLLAAAGGFEYVTALMTLVTAVLLQVLSNLANDLGDSLHGADGAGRQGPARAVQSGAVTVGAMKQAIFLSAALAAGSGLLLVAVALGTQGLRVAIPFVLLGGAAIWAAIAYTATRRPYGYVGLGDVMVFLFFGPVAVLGSYYLQVGSLPAALLLPAAAAGLLAVGVLNVNNVRDMAADAAAGKRTVAVRLGSRGARVYHAVLLGLAVAAGTVWVLVDYLSPWQFLYLPAAGPLFANARGVWRLTGAALDPLLRQLALSALLYALLFGVGQLLGRA